MASQHVETLIIGAGQAGLATGYHLKKLGREFLVVDGNERVGDNWRCHWDSMRLFTPAKYDGLPGLEFKPLFGVFEYDLYGRVNYFYVLGVLAVVFFFVRRIVYSPFGQALTGIRENVRRMHAIGSPVHRRLVTVYTIAAGIAGVAGALFTQTNAYVTLTVFEFDSSAKVMVMLILGGTGRLYGPFIGAVIYMVMEDYFSKLSPTFWQFGIGLMLVLAVLFARRGLLGLAETGWRKLSQRGAP